VICNPPIEALAAYLQAQEEPAADVAFLVLGTHVYFARERVLPHAPTSPVVKLVQGVWANQPEMARKILRARIYTTSVASVMDRGMVRVSAKRMTDQIQVHVNKGMARELASKYGFVEVEMPVKIPEPALAPIDFDPTVPHSDEVFMKLAHELAQSIDRTGPFWSVDRPVAALLVSPDHRLLGWARNSNAKNRTLHAEVILLQNYFRLFGSPIPSGSTVFVTLKSCKMCAAMIHHCAENIARIRVFFGEYDAGPMGQCTILESVTNQHRLPIEKHLPYNLTGCETHFHAGLSKQI
jgi:tRNA(Arg) A34 adenosine deaminase TadA